MYNLFCRNIANYKNYVEEESYRYKVALPFLLLTDKELYEREKNKNSDLFYNLVEILRSAENVKTLNRYRKFNVFLREVYDKGFVLTNSNEEQRISKERLLDQI